jgi:hypothetical protein
MSEVLGLGTYGMQQDQWGARSARDVTQSALASAAWFRRVKEVAAGSRDRYSGLEIARYGHVLLLTSFIGPLAPRFQPLR